MSRKRLGILLSGRGSNFVAIADAIDSGRLNAEIAVVISNREDAPGLEIAQKRGLGAVSTRKAGFDLADELERYRVDFVCLAGYMKILNPGFVSKYHHRILNIHPSLLPSFPGLHAQAQALAHGVKFSGCTVHFVDEGLDSGPIIRQAIVPVLDADTEETLSARILKEEHRIYSDAIALVISGKYRISGRRIVEGE
jgi:phosphoribosylglycinamide formyltransferase 1